MLYSGPSHKGCKLDTFFGSDFDDGLFAVIGVQSDRVRKSVREYDRV